MKVFLIAIFIIFFSVYTAIFIQIKQLGIPAFVLRTDISAFHTAGKIILHGQGKYLYKFDTQFSWQKQLTPAASIKLLNPFRNPPFVAIFFAPLALFPLQTAYGVFFLINIFIILFIYHSFTSLLPESSKSDKLFLFFSFLVFPPVITTLFLDQVSLLLMLAFLNAYIAIQKHQSFRTGIWLSLLLIKPQYLILIILVLILNRKVKELISIIFVSIILALLSYIFVGLEGIQNYTSYIFGLLIHQDPYPIPSWMMQTLKGGLETLFQNHFFFVTQALWLLGSLVIIIITVKMRELYSFRSTHFPLAWSLLIIGTILISPYTHTPDLSLLYIPIFLTISYFYKQKRVIPHILIFASVLLYFVGFINDIVARTTGIQISVIMMIFFFFSLKTILKSR